MLVMAHTALLLKPCDDLLRLFKLYLQKKRKKNKKRTKQQKQKSNTHTHNGCGCICNKHSSNYESVDDRHTTAMYIHNGSNDVHTLL